MATKIKQKEILNKYSVSFAIPDKKKKTKNSWRKYVKPLRKKVGRASERVDAIVYGS